MAQDALPLDPTPAAPEPDLSIASHEAHFPQSGRIPSVAVQADDEDADEPAAPVGDAAPPPEAPRGDPPRPDAMPEPHSRPAERAKTPRHRAKSQQATPADAPRINELT